MILCAGALVSPKLLMLSGIGDPGQLRSVGIAVRHALHGVGRNLREHPCIMQNWEVDVPTLNSEKLFSRKALGHGLNWLLRGAWRRRVNEDNVDLNRNFVNHGKTYFKTPYYGELHDLLIPDGAQAPVRIQSDPGIEQFRKVRGEAAFQIGAMGQYSHPDGINFGGHAPVWSARMEGP